MAKTWGDIQHECLQLMFNDTIDGVEVITDDNADYRAAMAHAANYALRDLASSAAPIVCRLSLSLNPIANMLGDGDGMFSVTHSAGQDITFSACDPKAFYFEVDNPCTIYVEELDASGVLIDATARIFNNTSSRSYTAYRGHFAASVRGAMVRLRFTGGTAYNIRNVAFYAETFPSDDEVPPFTRYDRYDLRVLTSGKDIPKFMSLTPNSVVCVTSRYTRSDDFHWEGTSTIVFDHYAVGQWDIYYNAYPMELVAPTRAKLPPHEITDIGTPDDTELELLPEALDIVPLYMASRLYAEDNPALASQYLNRYMVRRAELSERDTSLGTNEISCESGWW